MRANLGCGSVQPEAWDNIDIGDHGQEFYMDLLEGPWNVRHYRPDVAVEFVNLDDRYDYIVANHLLSCFSHHELLDPVLPNIFKMLKPGGVLRILVPDAAEAAWQFVVSRNAAWFPLGDDLPGVEERFCTFLPWFGESKSIFTAAYLASLGRQVGFGTSRDLEHRRSYYLPDSEIASLDDREQQALRMEFRRPA